MDRTRNSQSFDRRAEQSRSSSPSPVAKRVDNATIHSTRPPWVRHVLGVMGLVCLAIAGYYFAVPPRAESAVFVQGSCIKSGLVLLATWLAYPHLDRLPRWLFAPVLGLILMIAFRPRITAILLRFSVFLLPILIAIWLLRPRQRRR